jgi:beta-lactamase class A
MKFSTTRRPQRAAAVLVFTVASLMSMVSAHGSTTRDQLQSRLEALAQGARPGTLGIAVLDLHSGATWRVNADRAYPMMSVFKAPVAAAVLARIDHGDMSFDQTTELTRAELGSGPIRDHFHGDRMTFTVRQLLTAAVSHSDNSAVDALIKLLGGPDVATAFLQAHGIRGMRVDLDEAGMGRIFEDTKPAANEMPAQESQRLHRGYAAFLADPRNRSTPDAAVTFLRKLWGNELISKTSTHYLIDLMRRQTVPNRLRAGLPAGVELADKCGTSYTLGKVTAAFNDIGILTWPDGHTVIVAAFLTASQAPEDERKATFAELARDVAEALHP